MLPRGGPWIEVSLLSAEQIENIRLSPRFTSLPGVMAWLRRLNDELECGMRDTGSSMDAAISSS